MCGINGIYAYNGAASGPNEAELLRTREAMYARGPDGEGVWWSADRRLAFGHRRLSIQDLSDRASQPMLAPGGHAVISYNGEIYNTPALRKDLQADGATFQTSSDTEVLLHLYARDGAAMVHRLRGMYAFAIWDVAKEHLFLARDPYGIKPLYTANDGWTFRFASQVKALLAGGNISREPEPAGLVGFHLFGSVPEPFTLYRDIRALPAGHSQIIDRAGPREPQAFTSVADEIRTHQHTNEPPDALLRQGLRDSVAAHLLSDVPVGVFLSAGVDSGALLGLMRDAGQKEIQAVTLAFDEFAGTHEDEAPLAAQIAAHYGADHSIYRVSRDEYEADLPQILDAMDQPSIDGVNTWFVAKAAKAAGLKVALSGLGGDELLAGYPSFHDIPRSVGLLRAPSLVPGLGALFSVLMGGLAPDRPKMRGLVRYGGTWAGAYFLRRGLFLPEELKTHLDADTVRRGLRRLKPFRRLASALSPNPGSSTARVCALESSCYMRNQLLRDADWAGMAHSVEIRTPLVDVELLRAAAPALQSMRPGQGKRLFGSTPATPLPSEIITRAKTGFIIPTGHWSGGPNSATQRSKGLASRTWARDVLEGFVTRPQIAKNAP